MSSGEYSTQTKSSGIVTLQYLLRFQSSVQYNLDKEVSRSRSDSRIILGHASVLERLDEEMSRCHLDDRLCPPCYCDIKTAGEESRASENRTTIIMEVELHEVDRSDGLLDREYNSSSLRPHEEAGMDDENDLEHALVRPPSHCLCS